jgi:putative nucleotidyltransferase with HDIG domain
LAPLPTADADLLVLDEVRRLARDLAPEITSLPRLSRVVEQFLQDAGRDTASAGEIAGALALDPVLQGWVLRQANSGYLNLSRPVRTIAEACVVLGLGNVTRLVYAACTRDLLRHPLSCYRFPGDGFWLHGLAVGTAARRLARLLGPRSPLPSEAAQVAGLLHDIGKLLLDRRLPRAGGPRQVSLVEEIDAAGLDHGMFSAAVATVWGLPDAITGAIAGHHAGRPQPAARLIAVADLLMQHWGVGLWTYPRLDLEPPRRELLAMAAPLGLEPPLLDRWCGELPPLLAGLAEMVHAIGHGVPPQLEPGVAAPDMAAPASRGHPRRPRRQAERARQERSTRRRSRR